MSSYPHGQTNGTNHHWFGRNRNPIWPHFLVRFRLRPLIHQFRRPFLQCDGPSLESWFFIKQPTRQRGRLPVTILWFLGIFYTISYSQLTKQTFIKVEICTSYVYCRSVFLTFKWSSSTALMFQHSCSREALAFRKTISFSPENTNSEKTLNVQHVVYRHQIRYRNKPFPTKWLASQITLSPSHLFHHE